MYTSESIPFYDPFYAGGILSPFEISINRGSNTIFHIIIIAITNRLCSIFQSGDSAESDRHGIRKKEREKKRMF